MYKTACFVYLKCSIRKNNSNFVNFHFFNVLYNQEPQFRRGGLSLCLYDQHVATAFRLLFLRDSAMTFAKQLYKECVEKALRQLTIQLEKRRPKSITFRLKNSVFKRIIECSPEPIRPIHKHKTCNNKNIKEPKPCLIKELT